MSRFFDRARRKSPVFDRIAQNLENVLGPVINASNVAEYALERKDYQGYIDIYELPNVAPPFRSAFIEFDAPGSHTPLWRFDFRSVGMFFVELDFSEMPQWVQGWDLLPESERREIESKTRWVVALDIWVERGNGSLSIIGRKIIFIDSLGVAWFSPEAYSLPKEHWVHVVSIVYPALLTISFLHCKNVTVHESSPDPPLLKKSIRKHGMPLTKWYTLNINPMREILRREGKSEETGIKRALHICRGHFSTYTPERPLFGRVSGTFWIPQHTRGTANVGVVHKDYSIEGMKGS